MRAQAKKISHAIHGPQRDSGLSRGWLWRWQKRHGIGQVKICGEVRSADLEAAAAFPIQFGQYIKEEQLQEEQIYNCDETALYWRMLPDKTIAVKNNPDKDEGFKIIKDRVTFLLCTNATVSQKIKPLAIGRYRSPRCFQHINMSNLPIQFVSSANAWMTGQLFKD